MAFPRIITAKVAVPDCLGICDQFEEVFSMSAVIVRELYFIAFIELLLLGVVLPEQILRSSTF